MDTKATIREIVGLGHQPAQLKESALIVIDCQNTYRRGVMHLEGVEEAIVEIQRLLSMARDLRTPGIHIQHDAGSGSPYDIQSDIGAISSEVSPIEGELVVVKHFPNSFLQTDLEARLRELGINKVILAGFMTHMCVSSTAQ